MQQMQQYKNPPEVRKKRADYQRAYYARNLDKMRERERARYLTRPRTDAYRASLSAANASFRQRHPTYARDWAIARRAAQEALRIHYGAKPLGYSSSDLFLPPDTVTRWIHRKSPVPEASEASQTPPKRGDTGLSKKQCDHIKGRFYKDSQGRLDAIEYIFVSSMMTFNNGWQRMNSVEYQLHWTFPSEAAMIYHKMRYDDEYKQDPDTIYPPN